MGDFINFISGISEDMLPIGGVGGILGNTPDILKNYEKTKILYEKSSAKYLMVDSGGFQLFSINEDNMAIADPSQRTLIIMNPDKSIHLKKRFNLCAEHVVMANQLLHPDFIVSPDLPVPDPADPDQRRYLFLNSFGYCIYGAFMMAELLAQTASKAKLLIPIQAFDLAEFQLYLNHLQHIHFDGLSFPRRIMTMERMAAFFIRAYLAGVRTIHVLGTGRFSYIAFIAFFAKNYFTFTSIDSTDLQKFSQVNSYLEPFSLRPISLRMDSQDDLRQPIKCNCPWCSYHSSFAAIQNLPKHEKRAFMVNHNHFVVEQLMTEAYEHATTARDLYEFLSEKTTRFDDCKNVYRVLSLVEAVRLI